MKEMVLVFSIVILMAISLLHAQDIEIVDGVKIIHNNNPKWSKKAEIELKLVRKIGELEGEDTNYQFYRPKGILKDKEENIYVLDSGNNRIQKFNPDGKFTLTIGRQGMGPGEFEIPSFFTINKKSQIYVFGGRTMRIEKFSTSGEYLNSIKPVSEINILYIKSGCALKSGNLVIHPYVFLPPPKSAPLSTKTVG